MAVTLQHGSEDNARIQADLDRLAQDDVIGQLLNRNGRMAELATECGDIKLDWVDGVEVALQHSDWLQQCEEEAYEILQQDIRHIIWSGMGGSVHMRVSFVMRKGDLVFPRPSSKAVVSVFTSILSLLN
jgi:hypothetical protein